MFRQSQKIKRVFRAKVLIVGGNPLEGVGAV